MNVRPAIFACVLMWSDSISKVGIFSNLFVCSKSLIVSLSNFNMDRYVIIKLAKSGISNNFKAE